MSVVATASTSAHPSTGGIAAGSVFSPKTTKNTAANRSRSGSSSLVALRAVEPEIAMPSRNAPDRRGHLQRRRDARDQQRRPSSLSRNTSRSGESTIAET